MKSVSIAAAAGIAACSVGAAEASIRPALTSSVAPGNHASRRSPLGAAGVKVAEGDLAERILDMRGGAKARARKRGGRTATLGSLSSGAEKKTATGKKKVQAAAMAEKKATGAADLMTKYKAIPSLTRIYITSVSVVTLFGLILGEELAQGLFALDPVRTLYGFELWRPISAASFLGTPSISTLMSAYYLYEYGSSLERAYGSAQFLVFLVGQIGLLSVLSVLLGQPFFASSVITAMLHVLSRSMPKQKVKWLIFNVPYWSLPLGLMASDVLQSQNNPAASVPHIMGILSGHFYFFHKYVWPKAGGEDWLAAPDFLRRRLDPDARDNSRKSLDEAIRKRKKGKGRKLGA